MSNQPKQPYIRYDQRGQTVYGGQTNVAGDQHVHHHYPLPPPRTGQRCDFYAHIHLPPNFVPRTELFAEIKQAILAGSDQVDGNTVTPPATSKSRVDALHGMGGIGKTVIARALCDDEEVRETFPDGILWATLGQTPEQDLDSRLRGWIAALGGIITEVAPSRESLKNNLANLLNERRCLLIVDDVWHPSHARWFQFDAPACYLLITTRDAEVARRLGATVRPVPVMTKTDAIALLCQWGGVRVAGADPELMKAIVYRLGRLPLALKLAGSQLSRRSNIQEWLERFDAKQLKEKRVYEAHDNLETTFALSLDELSKEKRYLYTTLVIFKEDEATPQIVVEKLWSALKQLDSSDTADLIADLADRALIHLVYDVGADQNMVSLHDLLRDFLRIELTDQGVIDTRRQLIAHYRQTPGRTHWHSVPDDGYLYDHLAYHLSALAEYDETAALELDGLFGDQQWMHVQTTHDGYTFNGYIRDLMLAWDFVYGQTLGEIEQGEIPSTVVTCVRYALIRVWISSAIAAIPNALITLWARMGEVDRAISYAHNIPDPSSRFEVYQVIADLLYEQGELEGAKDLLKRAYQESQDLQSETDPTLPLALAFTFWKKEIDIDQAKQIAGKVAEQLIHQYPNRSDLDTGLSHYLVMTAEILHQLGDTGYAVELLEKAHVCASEFFHIYPQHCISLAECFIRLAKSERAAEVLRLLTQQFEETERIRKTELVESLEENRQYILKLSDYAAAFAEHYQPLPEFPFHWQQSVEAIEQASRLLQDSDGARAQQLIHQEIDTIKIAIQDSGFDALEMAEAIDPDPLVCIHRSLQSVYRKINLFIERRQREYANELECAVGAVLILLQLDQVEAANERLEWILRQAPTKLVDAHLLEILIKVLAILIDREELVHTRRTLANIVTVLNDISEATDWYIHNCTVISACLAHMEPTKFMAHAWPELQALTRSDSKFYILCGLPENFAIPGKAKLLAHLLDQIWSALVARPTTYDRDNSLLQTIWSAACRKEPNWLSALENRIDDIQDPQFNIPAYCTLAQAWLSIGNQAQTLALTRRIERKLKVSVTLETKLSMLLQFAQTFTQANQFNYAKQIIQVAIDLAPQTPTWYKFDILCDIAEMLLQLNELKMALEVAHRAWDLSKASPTYWPRIGKILLEIGDNPSAHLFADELMVALESYLSPTVAILRETAELMVNLRRPDTLSILLDIAIAEERSDKKRKFGTILFRYDEVASVYTGISKALYNTGQMELAAKAAIRAFNNLSISTRSNFVPLTEIAPMLKSDIGSELEVVKFLVQWVESWRTNQIREAWALSQIAAELVGVGELELTKLLLVEIWPRLDVTEVRIWIHTQTNLAWIYINLGEMDRAQQINSDSLRRNVSLDDSQFIAVSGMTYSKLLTHLGEYQRALDVIQRLNHDRDKITAYQCMIDILLQSEQLMMFPLIVAHVDACLSDKRLISALSDKMEVMSYIVQAYTKHNGRDESVQLFNKFISHAFQGRRDIVYEVLTAFAPALHSLDRGEILWEIVFIQQVSC